MKRIRRYGGFLIGDRVRDKKTLTEGKVIGFTRGYVVIDFPINDRLTQIVSLMPNQLINLTRIEEKYRKIIDELPPISEETAKEIIEDSCKPMTNRPVFDLRGTDFGEIQNDWSTKDLSKEEIKMARDIVNEALQQTDIFLLL